MSDIDKFQSTPGRSAGRIGTEMRFFAGFVLFQSTARPLGRANPERVALLRLR